MNRRSPVARTVAGNPAPQAWADNAGMVASIACAVHCAAIPLAVAYLPALGLEWLAAEGFHQWMAAVCLVLACAAFVPGWQMHRSFVPAGLGTSGVLLITLAAYGLESRCCPGSMHAQDEVAAGSSRADLSGPSNQSETQASIVTPQRTSVRPERASLVGGLAPWVTPLGGFLLVLGHLANHRRTCECRSG